MAIEIVRGNGAPAPGPAAPGVPEPRQKELLARLDGVLKMTNGEMPIGIEVQNAAEQAFLEAAKKGRKHAGAISIELPEPPTFHRRYLKQLESEGKA